MEWCWSAIGFQMMRCIMTFKPALIEGKLNSLRVIGDAEAPNIIAQAVFSGHLAAREFEEEKVEGTPFKVERIL